MDLPSTAPAATGHKTYVFVDEYNRHKRLKVMRACDGCRKRKIRCDGALQNGPWPCGACMRLKLKCVPPTLDQDDELETPISATNSSPISFHTTTFMSSNDSDDALSQTTMIHEWNANATPSVPLSATVSASSAPVRHDSDPGALSSQSFSQQLGPRLGPGYADDEYFASATAPVQYQSTGPPSFLRSHTIGTEGSSASGGDPQEVDATVRELSEQMGDLAIDYTSSAAYITNEKKTLAETFETPAADDYGVLLPASVGTDSIVRIPPEMMLAEERAMDYFGYFFNYVHPYVPVLNRKQFYEQWRTARASISPLLLEGIFACVARYLDDQHEVRRWLALASRHEESFKDVPRVSTIQALIILTKAREHVPIRGYYFRSWMAVKYMTTMAFDLGLQDHHEEHRLGNGCRLSRPDCLIRKRIWQTLFALEVLVGAPQGRSDFAVELETVDFDLPKPMPDLEAFEYQLARRTTYFAQAVRNIKQTNNLWQSMRRYRKDWALDPMFMRQNEVIATWLQNLPSDLQISYADDDSPPWLGNDHYVAYLHTYHHLVVIMHHRPQLQTLLEKRDPSFKTHLDICNESASVMCRLQEALFRDFGLHGLQFMQRGIGFTIYCVLTCTMLHLATITSPDPATHSRARKYFTRHMRLLESCIVEATPEVRVQCNALREAFSEDTTKPFELKASLGMQSPRSDNYSPTPPALQQSQDVTPVQGTPAWSQLADAASSKTMSPASEFTRPYDGIHAQTNTPYSAPGFAGPVQTTYDPRTVPQAVPVSSPAYGLQRALSNEQPQPVWDPSGIFQQWNTAFGAQPQAQAHAVQQPAPMPNPGPHPAAMPLMTQQQPNIGQQAIYGPQQFTANVSPVEAIPAMPTVTPVMWQDAFTNAYVSGHGHKRFREENLDPHHYSQYQKRRT